MSLRDIRKAAEGQTAAKRAAPTRAQDMTAEEREQAAIRNYGTPDPNFVQQYNFKVTPSGNNTRFQEQYDAINQGWRRNMKNNVVLGGQLLDLYDSTDAASAEKKAGELQRAAEQYDAIAQSAARAAEQPLRLSKADQVRAQRWAEDEAGIEGRVTDAQARLNDAQAALERYYNTHDWVQGDTQVTALENAVRQAQSDLSLSTAARDAFKRGGELDSRAKAERESKETYAVESEETARQLQAERLAIANGTSSQTPYRKTDPETGARYLTTDRYEALKAEMEKEKTARDRSRSSLDAYQNAYYQEKRGATIRLLEQVQDEGDFQATAAGFNAGALQIPNAGGDRMTKLAVRYALDPAYRTQMAEELGADYGTGWDYLLYLNDAEKQTLAYYAGKGDWEKAGSYLKNLEWDLNARWAAAEEPVWKERFQKDPVMGLLVNTASGFTSPIAYASTLGNGLENLTGQGYTPVDPNSNYMSGPRSRSLVREAFTDGKGDIARFLIDTGMSMADFLSQSVFGAASLPMMATTAAADKSYELAQQGVAPGKALALSTISGAVEWATEKLPLENLLDMARGGKQAAESFVRNVLKQVGTEASEELISEYAGNIAENAILGDASSFNQYIQELMSHGMSRAEAEKLATKQFFVVNPAMAALGGGLSGGVMGLGASAIGALTGPRTASNNQGINLDGTNQNMQQTASSGQSGDVSVVELLTNPEARAGAATIDTAVQGTYDYMGQRVERALAMRREGASPSQVFGETGLVAMANGALQDGIGGPVVWRPDNGQLGTGEANPSPSQSGRGTWGAVSEYDGRGTESMGGQEAGSRQKWESLGEGERLAAQDVILRYADQNRTEEQAALREAFGSDEAFARQFYNLYSQGDVMAETWQAFMGDVSGLTAELNARLGNTLTGQGANYGTEYQRNNQQGGRGEAAQELDATLSGSRGESGQGGRGIYGETPGGVFGQETGLAGYDWYNNDVNYGEAPRLIQSSQQGDIGNSVGAARRNMTEYSTLQNQYGIMPDGENPSRSAPVPNRGGDGRNVMRTARTAAEASVTPDSRVEQIEQAVIGGALGYDGVSNNDLVADVEADIVKYGWQESLKKWQRDVYEGKVSDRLVATGAVLLNNLGNSGVSATEYTSLLIDYSALLNKAGKAVQSARILKRLTPEYRLFGIQKTIEALAEEYGNKYDFTLDESLVEEYRNAETAAQRDDVISKMQQSIAEQIPSTLLDKFTALRYVNMLGNFKTQVRNVLGNASMYVAAKSKNRNAAAIELAWNKLSKKGVERNHSLLVSRDLKRAAKEDFKNVQKIALGESKYQDSGIGSNLSEIENRRTIFKNNGTWGTRGDSNPFAKAARKVTDIAWKVPEAYRKVTNWAMEQGDVIFSRATYADALGGWMKAHGITAEQWLNGEIDSVTMDKGRAFAIKESQEATFRDNNAFSSWVSRIGRRKDTPKAVKVLAEGTVPFRKTPANVAVRMEEYSPLGLINAAVIAVQAKKGKGNFTGNDVINSIAKSLTGSAILGLGYLLRKMGVLSGGDDEDDVQDYSLIIPGVGAFSLDWLSPIVAPLFMGVELCDALDGDLAWDEIDNVITSIAEPMLNMSMLSGVSDAIDNVKFSDNNLMQMAARAALGYLTQGLTNTLIGQIERTSEQYRQTTTPDKDSGIPTWLQREFGKASAKIPGFDIFQADYVDEWGRKQENGNIFLRALTSFVSPGYFDKAEDNSVVLEAIELANRGYSDAVPNKPQNSFNLKPDNGGDEPRTINLNAKEYQAFLENVGGARLEMATDLVDRYDQLSDSAKERALAWAYDFALAEGKAAISGYEYDATEKALAEMNEADRVDYLAYKAAFYDLQKKGDESAYEDLMQGFDDLDNDVQKALNDVSLFEKTWDAMSAGFSYEDLELAQECYNSVNALDENGKSVSGLKKQRALALATAKGMSAADFEKLYEIIK